MRKLYFITGNKNKFEEIQKIIPFIEQYILELPEIQENSLKEIIQGKLEFAARHMPYSNLIVEDTGLYLDCLGGFPGPFIKWFLKNNSLKQIYNITQKLENSNVQAKTIIGYQTENNETCFFEGEKRGKIVFPRGGGRFKWDQIFQPENYKITFAEMNMEEKNKLSARSIATRKLKEFLENKI